MQSSKKEHRRESPAQLWGLISSEAEKWFKKGNSAFGGPDPGPRAAAQTHPHLQSCQQSPRPWGQRFQSSFQAAAAESPQLQPLLRAGEAQAELWGCCWAPSPTSCSSQAPLCPQIYHDACLCFNFNLILLLFTPASMNNLPKPLFLWGSFWTVQ